MNNKSILMPHACQWIGWGLLLLSVLMLLANGLFIHNIDVAWYLAKASHILLILSLFFICLSREKVEDEMISGLRLKAIGITTYVFFVLFLVLSLILEVKPGFSKAADSLSLYLSELFLIVLPVLLFGLYYALFKGMLWRSDKVKGL